MRSHTALLKTLSIVPLGNGQYGVVHRHADGRLARVQPFGSKHEAESFVAHQRRGGYALENPLSRNAMIGLGVGGAAFLGLVAYLALRKPVATTPQTPAAGGGITPTAGGPTTSGQFVGGDFVTNSAPTTHAVDDGVQLHLQSGGIIEGQVATANGTAYSIIITQGDPKEPSVPVGMTLLNIPQAYLF